MSVTPREQLVVDGLRSSLPLVASLIRAAVVYGILDIVEGTVGGDGHRGSSVPRLERLHEVAACVHVAADLGPVVTREARVEEIPRAGDHGSLSQGQKLPRPQLALTLAELLARRRVQIHGRRRVADVSPQRPDVDAGRTVTITYRDA